MRILALVWLATVACAQPQPQTKFYTYVGDIGPRHVLLAWGTTTGANTIGRSSPSHGPATVKVGDLTINEAKRNWTTVTNLEPDKEYEYEIRVRDQKVGSGKFRTWPEKSEKLCFFVIGDYGNGSNAQMRIAEKMRDEFKDHQGGDCPIRFVATTGDNIYGDLTIFGGRRNSGDEDSEWELKFFRPYEEIIRSAPFYPTLGNHDGNETESRLDLATYLDNFFFPQGALSRYYRFSYGGFVDFFALDSTVSTEKGPRSQIFARGSEQHKWLTSNLADSKTLWKVAYLHHPFFSAGPRHAAAYKMLEHFADLMNQNGVEVVFSGHEHNFQVAEESPRTRGIRFVVTGSGGELRGERVTPREMEAEAIAAWSPQHHFLSVEIDKREMTIKALGYEEIKPVGRDGKRFELPVKIKLPD